MREDYQRRRDLQQKYRETLKAMFEHDELDSDVLFDRLIYMAKKNTGVEVHGDDEYFVPAGFDFVAFMEDYTQLVSK